VKQNLLTCNFHDTGPRKKWMYSLPSESYFMLHMESSGRFYEISTVILAVICRILLKKEEVSTGTFTNTIPSSSIKARKLYSSTHRKSMVGDELAFSKLTRRCSKMCITTPWNRHYPLLGRIVDNDWQCRHASCHCWQWRGDTAWVKSLIVTYKDQIIQAYWDTRLT
jgi:hypothetical protein